MADATYNKYLEAVKEFNEAKTEYDQMLDRYYPVTVDLGLGNPIRSGEPITIEALEECQRAEKRFKDAEERLVQAQRRL